MSDESLVQATLFDLPDNSPKKKAKVNPKKEGSRKPKVEPPKPVYRPKPPPWTYSQWVTIFSGDKSLAAYWYKKSLPPESRRE